MTPEDQQKELHTRLRGSLSPFVQKVFHELNPGDRFFDSWYLDAMTHRLEQCRTGSCKTIDYHGAATVLEIDRDLGRVPGISSRRNPAERILCISYGNELAL